MDRRWDPTPIHSLEGVRTEISLAILAYNVKRIIRLFGATWLIQAIRA